MTVTRKAKRLWPPDLVGRARHDDSWAKAGLVWPEGNQGRENERERSRANRKGEEDESSLKPPRFHPSI